MTWWRRSLLCRSHIHPHHQRILDREAALRTRCYSRTTVQSAQHKDDGGKKRPAHMSNLEWMQLQHYERWRKRLLEDPYKTLFGSSEDMLKGKGLGDWDWVYKTFPKWMLQDMDVGDKTQELSKDKTEKPNYPTVKAKDTGEEVPLHIFRQRDGSWGPKPDTRWPLPSEDRYGNFHVPGMKGEGPFALAQSLRQTKPAPIEKNESSGVVSPSDLRRPRERSDVKVVGKPTSPPTLPKQDTTSATEYPKDPSNVEPPTSSPRKHPSITPSEQINESDYDKRLAEFAAGKEARARESSFIDEFLNIKSHDEAAAAAASDNKAWRQTALQRRAASDIIKKPEAQPSPLQTSETGPPQLKDSWRGAGLKEEERAWLLQQENPKLPEAVNDAAPSASRRSPSEVLKQLPEDDLDFISADDIRASMGSKRSRIPSDEQRKAERQNLEQSFAAADGASTIDSLKEMQIVNDQYVRRAARQLLDPEPRTDGKVTPPATEVVSQSAENAASKDSGSESRPSWLQTWGARFTNIFWQDPTEHADITKSKLFFDKAASYLKKGQTAMRQITEDLEKDIPASTQLLRRLKQDEQALDLAIHRLRKRSTDGHIHDMSPRKMQSMMKLKTTYQLTNEELEKAFDELRELVGTEAVANATGSFKRRLTAASKVLHKNAQLLRTLIWSLQARLEDPNIDRAILKNYKVVADRLLSLRDTEMTLVRLVDRAMLVYGVEPIPKDDVTADKPNFDACEEPFVRARLAADEHLIEEIKAHKAPLPSQVVADEAPTTTSTSSNKVLDESNPLAHSLYRPFAPAFNSLGTSKEFEAANESTKVEEGKSTLDTKLVEEVKQAYEDMYGKITPEHRQGTSVVEEVKESKEQEVKKFEMLKEEPVIAEVEPAQEKDISTQGTPEPSPSIFDNHGSVAGSEHLEAPSGIQRALEQNTLRGTAAAETISSQGSMPEKDAEAVKAVDDPTSSISNLPTHYIIIIRDPTSGIKITSTTTGPPRDTTPAMPLPQALAALERPEEFIPYIAPGTEVVSATKDMLVMRVPIQDSQAVPSQIPNWPWDSPGLPPGSVNPIDGTTRLSPTGYVGPEESQDQLDRDFEERRYSAGQAMLKRFQDNEITRQAALERMDEESYKEDRRRRRGGVIKTAIWVAGMCYVAGVVGEIASGA